MATENKDATYCTEYFYNSLGWLTKSVSKDEGTSHFVYRKDGQILFSQNAQQFAEDKFSYSIYDDNNRVIESGEYDENRGALRFWSGENIILSENDALSASLRENTSVSYLSQRHKIWYGEDGNEKNQDFVAGAISKTEYDEDSNVKGNSTYYSYTYDGKVDWIIRDHAYLNEKTIGYTYDFLGNVTEVAYQKGASDQFIHTYEYNKDQKLTAVHTQRGAESKQLQAKYKYYTHGQLKRVEVAENQQGIDYVYNINGMLKSINHPNLDKTLDPGNDGNNGFREDLFALALDYYAGDYTGNGNIKTSASLASNYNGNIAMVRWNQYNNKATGTGKQWGYKVGYNERNYLKEAVFGTYTHSSNSFATSEDYKVNNISYDAHGNIQSLKRNGYGSYRNMDNLQYNYSSSNANRLSYISDAYGSNTLLKDIATQASNNYQYNSIGQMTSNAADNISFNYDVTGKVSSYALPGGTGKYNYDDAGFRSTVKSVNGLKTHYVRDLSGNIMAIYNESGSPVEYPIYGNDRLGVAFEKSGSLVYNYELKDHLGNVRAIFSKSDLADATGYADYYPFGWEMPQRFKQSGTNARFAYQGEFAEKDQETGYNQFEARLYDSRIGRWLSTDPAGQFASPYLGMGNNPFMSVDPNGEVVVFIQGEGRAGFFVSGSVSLGIAFDHKLNAMIYSTVSLGGGINYGAFVGVNGGVCFVPTVNEFTGWGVNGGFVGSIGFGAALSFGLEGNLPIEDDGNWGRISGIGATVGLPGIGKGAFAGVYGEGSYTFMIKKGNIIDMVNYLFDQGGDFIEELGMTREELVFYMEDMFEKADLLESGSDDILK